MTREIKFRQKVKYGGWHYWGYIDGGFTTPLTGATETEESQQYIGLKDRNGKPIFEGDIVSGVVEFPQIMCGQSDENSNFKMAGVVFYDHIGFSLDCRRLQHMCDEERPGMVNYVDFIGDDGQVFNDGEVIGNVWEHPHLLK